MGRIVTVAGVLVAIGTAFIASGYQNIMDYIQLLFSFFNAPLFATFIIALFWKRATPWAGISGLVAGTLGAAAAHYLNEWGGHRPRHAAGGGLLGRRRRLHRRRGGHRASSRSSPSPSRSSSCAGLVWSETPDELRRPEREKGDHGWYRSPAVLGGGVIAATVALNFVFG